MYGFPLFLWGRASGRRFSDSAFAVLSDLGFEIPESDSGP